LSEIDGSQGPASTEGGRVVEGDVEFEVEWFEEEVAVGGVGIL